MLRSLPLLCTKGKFETTFRGIKTMTEKKKVIVIAGTTGVGKSQLSIQLATKFDGEIINSDSMQVYKDIPIITNKHPIEEREGVPHHVMNHVPWTEEYFLHKFEKECLETINDIHSRGKVPIIVGGTHYYLQVLFNKNMATREESGRQLNQRERDILESNNPQLIYDTLMENDPTIAKRYHPNDTRRVQRMLEIFYLTGEKPSESFNNQDLTLRFDTLFLWLYSEPAPLEKRLDDRVDVMLANGGMSEINQLYTYYKQHDFKQHQCENGVWQVIGFKEFLPWLEKEPAVTLEDCIDRMKTRTRQYAKRQVKWIRKMLIPDIQGDIYILNASDLEQWSELVSKRALLIADEFMHNKSITEARAPRGLEFLLEGLKTSTEKNVIQEQYTCDICRDKDNKKLLAIGEKNWLIHLKSKRHRSNLNRGKKKEQYEKWKLKQNE
ncbi:hypothetical protein NCAS_0B00500 [Naumovozyma castellii]|uniref:tRNA dimethylallyltransferase n=1 Tax=Naumovozyma castellii TaxID=27288 RepID=G0VB11_NAUCA|nr:hypothetical protein NCAS_0B00500 [Naumovozyma castellii CBS 4309]CCC68134.1 hypothetical protein NCAS_0B00500 [Naumovozyma castellii CBS 4309]